MQQPNDARASEVSLHPLYMVAFKITFHETVLYSFFISNGKE